MNAATGAAESGAASQTMTIPTVELSAPRIDSSSEDVLVSAVVEPAAAPGESLQDSVLKEMQEAASALPTPPEPTVTVSVTVE